MSNRYSTEDNPEAQYEPGSGEQVLRNKLGITAVEDINAVELELLDQLYAAVFDEVGVAQTLTSSAIAEWHRKWLGNVYEWAGLQRSVNMGKGDFYFAAAAQVPRLLRDLDNKYLGKYTPCAGMDDEALIEAIAVVHVEFILIHPFREGNGRLSRLLAEVMALQAGKPELDFSSWDAERDSYFAAIQQGLDCNYEPMKQLVRQVLHESEKGASA